MTVASIQTWTPELRAWLEVTAGHSGFACAGVVDLDDAGDGAARREEERFSNWIDHGYAGEMNYLKRRDESGALVRGSVRRAFPWARSVVVCAYDYHAAGPRSIDPAPPEAGWIARYAWSCRTLEDGSVAPADYHNELLTRLQGIEAGLLARAACETRCYVDTGPLVERTMAARAGIGWIGKNTCVINQQRGSWLLLGVIVTSLQAEVCAGRSDSREPQPKPVFGLRAADRCGTCTRCIDACPTGALLGSPSPTGPREMDASRCISYLTIEKKGDIPAELRAPIGRNVFGCDICQEVCPWNVRAVRVPRVDSAERPSVEAAAPVTPMHPRGELLNPALDALAAEDSTAFRRMFRGSPVERTGRKRLLRNVAVAMGNSGERRFLAKLDEWAAVAGDHPNDAALRDAARWARERIASRSRDGEIASLVTETDGGCGPEKAESVC